MRSNTNHPLCRVGACLNTNKSDQSAKLAYIDAVLATIEMPRNHRQLTHDNIRGEYWTNTYAEYIVHLAKFSGVDAILANQGVFLISDRVAVCYEDELYQLPSQVEPGWQRIKLSSIDGKARPHDRNAPQILISPDERCLIWQPEGCLRKQKRVSFFELTELLIEVGKHLARFEDAV